MASTCLFGTARFTSHDAVVVEGTRLRFRKALIATGSRSMLPSVAGLAEAGFLTNETVFDLTTLPASLLVIGGGPLGCELAQAFCRFGCRTVIVHDEPLFLPKEERDAAQMVSERWRATVSKSTSTPASSMCASKAARRSSRQSTMATSRPSCRRDIDWHRPRPSPSMA
jgi:pyruvate/2-oxoglutarate dehydrogenase complex dihydrolipoamide dehydrogenase (E3) component